MRRTSGSTRVLRIVCIITVLPTLLAPIPVTAASFEGLGDLPGPSFNSEANAVSGDGSIVVGRANNATGLNEAFRWTSAGGIQGIGSPFASTAALGISTDGSVIAGQGAARWTSGTGMQALTGVNGNAFAVSGDGAVVAGQLSASQAFRWTSAGGKQDLGDFAGGTFESRAKATNIDGSIVVGWGSNSGGIAPFRWTDATGMQLLPDLPGGNSIGDACAITPDGSVIVGFSGGPTGSEACRWTSSGVESLGTLGGTNVMAVGLGVSADGETVVGYSRRATGGFPTSITEPFIWDEVNGIRNLQTVLVTELGLDLTGWTLTEARAISLDASTIVGVGTNPAGRTEAWWAVIPEPSSIALLPAGAIALCRHARRRGPL